MLIMELWEIIRRKLTLIFRRRRSTSAKKKISKRQECNKQLIEILSNFLESYPDIRFGQALYILGILKQGANGDTIDIFSDEPIDILKRIKNKRIKHS